MEKQIKVLLVEDEAIAAMILKKKLNAIGYTVFKSVSTGENAIRCAKQDSPDIILMDIQLAGEMDGIHASSIIKSESDIPIIFITSYDDKSIRERAEKIKPLAYMIKPPNMNELKSILDSYFKSNNIS